METRTEYAIRLTAVRHGKWQTVIETLPDDHKTDREWAEQYAADRRTWQADAGRTPDAEIISRTVTATGWKTRSTGATMTRKPLARNDALAENFQDALVEQLTTPEGRELLRPRGGDEWAMVDGVETYAEARIFTQDKGLVLDLSDGSQVRVRIVAHSPAEEVNGRSAADRYADWEYARERADYDG